ncbi:hypothetical protein AB4254_12075 [Vibrio breoganii]
MTLNDMHYIPALIILVSLITLWVTDVYIPSRRFQVTYHNGNEEPTSVVLGVNYEGSGLLKSGIETTYPHKIVDGVVKTKKAVSGVFLTFSIDGSELEHDVNIQELLEMVPKSQYILMEEPAGQLQ